MSSQDWPLEGVGDPPEDREGFLVGLRFGKMNSEVTEEGRVDDRCLRLAGHTCEEASEGVMLPPPRNARPRSSVVPAGRPSFLRWPMCSVCPVSRAW